MPKLRSTALPLLLLAAIVCAARDAVADALSQPPACSSRHVYPADTDLDADDAKAIAAAWVKTGRGCEAFLDRHGQRHLFVFQDIAPSRTEGPAGAIKPQPVYIGGYDFETDLYNNRYMPPAIELEPGDKLHVRSVVCPGALPASKSPHQHGEGLKEDGQTRDAGLLCREFGLAADPKGAPSNLHTHGLIVSARNDIRGPADPERPGDNIYAYIPAGQMLDYTIAVPDELPRAALLEPGTGGGVPIAHPGGLYWYHPHLHGIAGYQVTSGLAGIISIGDPFQLMIPQRGPGEPPLDQWQVDRWREEQRARTDVRYVGLRDVQLEPQSVDGGPKFKKLDNADTALCGAWVRVNGNKSGGWALPQDETHARFPGGCRAEGKAWLFPLNDKLYPTIEVSEDRDTMLRLSNQSASVTYRLSIRSGFTPARPDTPEVSGLPLGFEIIAIDGVVAGLGGQLDPGSPQVVKSQRVEEIVMMPASRADIVIRNGFASRNRGEPYELVTRQMDMSGTEDGNGGPGADVWPDIALASLHLNGAKGEMTGVQRSMGTILSERAAPAKPAPAKSTPLVEGGLRSRSMTKAGYEGCVDDLALDGKSRRIVVFDHETKGSEEIFKIGYKRASQGAEPDGYIIAPQAFPEHFDWRSTGPAESQHLCVARGEEEVWELRNITNEVHNFHLHQAKFRLATRAEVQPVTDATTLTEVCPNENSDPRLPCGRDPTGYAKKVGLGPITAVQGRVDVLHDTFPVPPASFDADGKLVKPGQVFIKVGFYAREQVGRFVYHCHILEHEDKGMMAPIEIIDTDRRTSTSQGLLDKLKRFFSGPGGSKASAASLDGPPAEPLVCTAKLGSSARP